MLDWGGPDLVSRKRVLFARFHSKERSDGCRSASSTFDCRAGLFCGSTVLFAIGGVSRPQGGAGGRARRSFMVRPVPCTGRNGLCRVAACAAEPTKGGAGGSSWG